MLFSYSWLKELSGTRRSPQRLAELLMTHAFEVESVVKYPHGLDRVVIGKVLTVERHPNADRLRVAQVLTAKKEERTIVCGASNLAVGQKVVVALPGATLPGGISIKEASLRGIVSQGMICSEKELGLGSHHSGILVLPEAASIGQDVASFLGLIDTVLDIKILPDRACDALSYEGLAREIAALEGSTAPFLEHRPRVLFPRVGNKVPKITIKTERCRRYLALTADTLVQGATPLPIRARLILSGLRPISPLVDLTNYVMLETGQPVHAFDADAIPQSGLFVRQAKLRESLTLLDGTKLLLSKDDVVIADTRHPLALAGVMGGKSSGIEEKTKQVVFEIAYFDRGSIRRTTKRFRLATDAAYRFERGLDLVRQREAAERLIYHMREWGIAEPKAFREVGSRLSKEHAVVLELKTVERLLGIKIPLFQVAQSCSCLGLLVKKLPNRLALRVTIPLRRPDLQTPEDLIEEIGRLYGYENITPKPLSITAPAISSDHGKVFERELKGFFATAGWSEVMTYSFYSEKILLSAGLSKNLHLALANPMNPDQAFMRSTLFPNLFRIVGMNARNFNRFHIFEYGSVFRKGENGPEEEKHAALLSFDRTEKSSETHLLRIKGELEAYFSSLSVSVSWDTLVVQPATYFHPTQVANLTLGDKCFGAMGALHPDIARRFGSGGSPVVFAEFSVAPLCAASPESLVYREISRFPLAFRDISLIGPKKVLFSQIARVLKNAGDPLLYSIDLFDVYEGEEERSFALHLAFGHPEHTLSGNEVDECFDQIVRVSEKELGMRLRLS